MTEYELGKQEYHKRVSVFKFYVKGWQNLKGHSHSIPGLWDSDNGTKAGMPCFACMALNIELGNCHPNEYVNLERLK